MKPPPSSETTPIVVYNGSCPICSREIAAYRRRAARYGIALEFLDASRETDRLVAVGLDGDRALRRLHLVGGGRILGGVEAFAALWAGLPGWRWLARLVRLPGVRAVADFAYERIAAPLLYRWHRRRLSRHPPACR